MRKEIDIQGHKIKITLIKINPKRTVLSHIIIKLSKVLYESSKKKVTHHKQGSSNGVISGLLGRNLAGQKGVG